MPHKNSDLASTYLLQKAFIIRFIWDDPTVSWCILLKPSNGEDARLFPDVESLCFALEAILVRPSQENESRRRARG